MTSNPGHSTPLFAQRSDAPDSAQYLDDTTGQWQRCSDVMVQKFVEATGLVYNWSLCDLMDLSSQT